MNTNKDEKKFQGKAVSPGVAWGRALVLESSGQLIIKKEVSAIKEEIARLHRAIAESKKQLLKIKKKLSHKLGRAHAYILEAHILLLQDKVLIREISDLITKERVNAEWAVKSATGKLIRAYAGLKDEFFRERGSDIEDVVNRILMNLMGHKRIDRSWPRNDAIIIAADLNPSILAALDYNKVKAFALENGGSTSHTSILARSLSIPAVIRADHITSKINSGQIVIVDGYEGVVIASPTREEVAHYERKRPLVVDTEKDEPCTTLDGREFNLEANVEMVSQIRPALRIGAHGVGLFRSEFLSLQGRDWVPSEERQFKIYKTLAERVYPFSATIRTFDFGAEKMGSDHSIQREANPALGLRGIRLSLQSREMFDAQIRAILRASAYGKLKIVLPFISRIEEVLEAKQAIQSVKDCLQDEGIPFDPNIPLGVMIEVPAAVLSAESLSRQVDFFCIGTNDLIQYTLAVDRVGKSVCHLFEPFHPSVLQSIDLIVKAAKKRKIQVNVCGEAAANPIYAFILLGLGINHFSLNLNSIPVIKKFLRSVKLSRAVSLARKVRFLSTVTDVETYVSKWTTSTLS